MLTTSLKFIENPSIPKASYGSPQWCYSYIQLLHLCGVDRTTQSKKYSTFLPVDHKVFTSTWTHQTSHSLIQKTSLTFLKMVIKITWIRTTKHHLAQDVLKKSEQINYIKHNSILLYKNTMPPTQKIKIHCCLIIQSKSYLIKKMTMLIHLNGPITWTINE